MSLKKTCNSIAKPLCIPFNKSLNESTYPAQWKEAIVMPLFKKGEPNNPSNYRPISLLSCVGKLMERIVYKHLYNHLLANKLIYSNQSGFLKGHSTVAQLIDIFDQITKGIDEKKLTCMVFCDISKAFDRVWHTGLLFKLKQNGFDGNLLNWIKSYLGSRTQKVVVGASISQTLELNAGVPQGSVLGPLFFLVYVNDIVKHLQCTARLFADDTSLSCTTSNIYNIEIVLNRDLQVISNWAKQWLVDFNPHKTVAMLFSSHHAVPQPHVLFNNVPVNFVENHKHLGLTLSSNGKWHEHITNIVKSSSKILGIMRKIKYTVSRKTLNQIYISHLRPLLEYACVVWDGCALYEKEMLNKIQNEAARIVTGLTKSVSLSNLYSEINWHSLAERRKYLKLIHMYKIHNGLCPDYLQNLLPATVYQQSARNLRNANDYVIVTRRTELYSRSFIPSAIDLWNNLPRDIRLLDSLSRFKIKLKQLFLPNVETPLYFHTGDRKSSILHARLRNNCSDLKLHLFINHLEPSPLCVCGEVESVYHFFFICPRFSEQRTTLFETLHAIEQINCNTMLFGNDMLDNDTNCFIFKNVQIFIKTTKRFS